MIDAKYYRNKGDRRVVYGVARQRAALNLELLQAGVTDGAAESTFHLLLVRAPLPSVLARLLTQCSSTTLRFIALTENGARIRTA